MTDAASLEANDPAASESGALLRPGTGPVRPGRFLLPASAA